MKVKLLACFLGRSKVSLGPFVKSVTVPLKLLVCILYVSSNTAYLAEYFSDDNFYSFFIFDCTYEMCSIKNVNLSIKYEGIKLQKWLIACKKGINVVVRFLYLEIG